MHCLLFRVLELADGYTISYNNKLYLTALGSIRSCIETIVVAKQFKEKFKSILESKSGEELDKGCTELRQKFITGQKNKELENVACDTLNSRGMDGTKTRAINIITLLEKNPDLLEVYEMLSEFVHPNSLGIFDYYTKDNGDQLAVNPNGTYNLGINVEGIEYALHLFNHVYEELVSLHERLRSKEANFIQCNN